MAQRTTKNPAEKVIPVSSRAIAVRSFAKVNLALAVEGKRPNGYHEIQTVFQSIDLHDELEFRLSADLHLECHGLDATPPESNLVWKAARALAGATSTTLGAEIVLRKRIPIGAGLGGGSSNAAATLLALERLWDLEVPLDQLLSLASALGSDVPFFLHGGTARGAGRGDEVHPLPDFPSANLVVVYPGIQVSSGAAYQSLSLGLTSVGNANKIQRFSGRMNRGLECLTEIFNDFETSILPAYPEIREAKDFLDRRGATATLLSGSGSAVFGFFLDEESALAASREPVRETWRVFPAKTLSRADYFQRMFG